MEEAVRGRVTVRETFCLPDDRATLELCAGHGIDVVTVAPHVISALAETVQPRGPVAVIDIPESGPIRTVDSVVLWGVGDPGNAGTVIRTAAAFGFQVVATAGSVDLWSPKVVRSGMGGHFEVRPVEAVPANPETLISSGLRLVAMAADGDVPLSEAVAGEDAVAVIVGNEAHGIPAFVQEHGAVTTAAIQMPGSAESLNAAVAAAIAMYERIHVSGR